MRAPIFASLVAVAVLGGCQKENSGYCPNGECADATIDAPPVSCSTEGPDPTCPDDRPVCAGGQCGGCTADSDCDGRGNDVCLQSSGACVACDEDNAQASPPNGPEDECQVAGMQVCDGTTHTCRACQTGSECDSDVCNAGTCVAPAEVAYVATTGSGTACSQMTPCATMAAAIATRRPYISVGTGMYDGFVDFNQDTATVFAEGATFRRSTNGRVLHVHGGGAGSTVTIYGGSFEGNGGDDAVVAEVSAGSTLTIDGTTIRNGETKGLVVTGKLTARRCQISNNETVGLEVVSTSSPLEIVSCGFFFNKQNAVTMNTMSAVFVNNVVAKNGISGPFPPVKIDGVVAPDDSRFSHNTIVENTASGSTPAGAVSCAVPITLSNSIIYSNDGLAQVVTCVVNNSSIEGTLPSGVGNVSVAPVYRNADTNDFRLATTGNDGLKGVGDPAAATGAAATDIEGDARPMPAGTNPDVGADELP